MPPERSGSLPRTVASDPVVLTLAGVSLAVIGWLLWGPGGIAFHVLLRAWLGPALNLVLLAGAVRLARRSGRD
ncbi:hypothetical protein AB0C29_18325, partial [Actinoplanes sp. NPDC048791]